MSYTLNGTDLNTAYGFIPGKAPGSNLAIAGVWDMPKRMGTTSYSWGDEAGEEPYVDTTQLYFEGRDLTLYGIVTADSAGECLAQVNALKAYIDGLTDLVALACDWGEWDVYVKDKLQAQYLDQGVAVVVITFREPVVDMSAGGTLPTYTPAVTGSLDDFHELDGFDGQSFADWGLILMNKADYLDRAPTKGQRYSVHGEEGYQVTKTKDPEVTLRFLVSEVDYNAFKGVLNTFQKYLKAAGLRYLTQGEVSIAAGYVTEGFAVEQVNSEGGFTGIVTVKMILVPYTPDPEETMLDSDGEAMWDLDTQLMLDVG